MAKIVSKSQNARNYVVRIFLKKQKAEKFKFIQVFFHVWAHVTWKRVIADFVFIDFFSCRLSRWMPSTGNAQSRADGVDRLKRFVNWASDLTESTVRAQAEYHWSVFCWFRFAAHRTEKKKGVEVVVVKNSRSKLLHNVDVEQFDAQYMNSLTVKVSDRFHDRFLIIDKTTLIHVGASLNHLGKKCFAFSSLDKSNIPDILAKI